jgi:hypothetical protein
MLQLTWSVFFSVGLETWFPVLQGIADKGFSGHPLFPSIEFLQQATGIEVRYNSHIKREEVC